MIGRPIHPCGRGVCSGHVRTPFGLLAAFVTGLGAAACAAVVDDGPEEPVYVCTDDEALDLFQARIAPLLSSDRASTCNKCHLSGIDLGLYAQADPCATMACMVESGIVDLEQPEDSLVLTWILRAESAEAAPGSALITDDVIEAEHDAVLQWIGYNATCGAEVCAPVENPCGSTAVAPCELPDSSSSGPTKPFDDPGDCSDHTLEAGFAALVYSWRGRCYPCHFDSHDGSPEDAPRWIHDGDCELGSLLTMHDVVNSGLVDAADPEASLLLLKPLAESEGGVPHGGHDKFAGKDDPAYRDYLTWIERWAACQE